MRMSTQRRITLGFVGLLLVAILLVAPRTASADIVHNDDVIINGSLGVGFDATNGMSFGFDTIVLKENNLRLFFDDTSTSAAFPRNDWRLIANDSSNGGDEYFAIEDATAGRKVFRVEAGARSNALVVDAQGDLGLGTLTPALDIDIKTGDTPSVRLQQDGTSGFTPQTWDLAGNETNFFIRDATGGSKLPFRIRIGAPTSSIDIAGSGNVGLGDASADAHLEVSANGTTGAAALLVSSNDNNDGDLFTVMESGKVGVGTTSPNGTLDVRFAKNSGAFTNPGIDQGLLTIADTTTQGTGVGGGLLFLGAYQGTTITDAAAIQAQKSNSVNGNFSFDLTFHTRENGGNNGERMRINSSGNVGIGETNPTFPLEVGTANGAHVTSGGVWQNGSSREFKENIKDVATGEARDTVMNLKPVTYNYKLEPGEQYVGFIAEDVPELVATNSRKYLSAMDIVSVVTKVVQDQQQTIERQQETISALSERIEQLEGQTQAQD